MVRTLPLEEKDLDKLFDLKCKNFLKKMITGKYYSYNEIAELILKNSFHLPHLKDKKSANNILDIAYVESVIQAQYAVGNLRCGEKNGERYYSRI